MLLIEALRAVKALRIKIGDLNLKISHNSAHRTDRPTDYTDPASEIRSWQDQVHAATKEMETLLLRIAYTNLTYKVTMKIGDNEITKPIAGWVLRVRELATLDAQAWKNCTNRGLTVSIDPRDQTKVNTVTLNFNARERDKKVEEYTTEPHIISTRLETVNATTTLLELPG